MRFLQWALFPFNGCRRFTGNIVDDAVDVVDFVYDAARDFIEDVVRNAGPISRHEVCRRNAAQGQGVVIGSEVAHDADGAVIGKDGKVLVDVALHAGIGDFFAENGIGIAEDIQFIFGDFAHDADSQARSRERLTPYEVFGKAKFSPEFADFVFKEVAKGFDEPLKSTTAGRPPTL